MTVVTWLTRHNKLTYVHAFSQVILLVAVHDTFHQAGQIRLVPVQFRVVRGHCIATTVRRGRVRGVGTPGAFVVQAGPGDVVVMVVAILPKQKKDNEIV